MKLAYVSHLMNISHSSNAFLDPFDVIAAELKDKTPFPNETHWLGKMPIESWLTPRPQPKDLPLLTSLQTEAFLEANGCWDYAHKVAQFVEEKVFPYRPVMIGVDHSSTGGLLLALAKCYGNLNVVVLDAHFDVMTFNELLPSWKSHSSGREPPFYHCGNFLCWVLEKEIIRPENLWVVGVAQGMVPEENRSSAVSPLGNNEREVKRWVNEGVHLVSKQLVSSDSMCLELTGPTYVSIDMDVGSLSSVFSARFMNCYGLTMEEFVGLLSVVRRSLEDAEVPLVGLDVMEVDIHFLEASEGMPVQDYTRNIIKKAFEIMLSEAYNP